MTRNALLFLAMCLVWGLTWLPVKLAAAETPPVLLAAVRFVLAGLCFFAWSAAAGLNARPALPARLALSTALITVGCYGFLFWGIARAPTGLAAIVNFSLIPVFTIAVGALHGEERVTGRQAAAIALGVLGLTLLFWARIGAGSGEVALGLGAIVLATLSYAWGAILSRPLVRVMPPVSLAAWQTFAGGLGLLAVSFALEQPTFEHLAALALWPAWPSLAFLVIGGSLIGFSIYLKLLRDWGAFRAGLYAFVSPAIAVGAGVAVLDEPFGLPEATGAVIMFGATALALKRPEADASAATDSTPTPRP